MPAIKKHRSRVRGLKNKSIKKKRRKISCLNCQYIDSMTIWNDYFRGKTAENTIFQ